MPVRLRPATRADPPRILAVRRGTAENRLTDRLLATHAMARTPFSLREKVVGEARRMRVRGEAPWPKTLPTRK